jgi:predicted RNase H-like nuclease
LEQRTTLSEERPDISPGAFVVGADGCRAGWFVVIQYLESGGTEHMTVPDFTTLLDRCAGARVLAVDMPIGLPDRAEKGGRPVDRLARELLKPHRSSSVFSAPCRPALACRTYEEAVAVTRALSATGQSLTRQSFGLFSKLREVDELMTAERQSTVYEVHPELSFARISGGRPLEVSKKQRDGQDARVELLRRAGFEISSSSVKGLARAGVGRIDVLDAHAACWSAARIARGQAERLGRHADVDSRGLRMEMWF